jgi:hypothetical protein
LNIRELGGRTSLLSPAARRWLAEEWMEDYAYIAKTFMSRPHGRLFYDSLPDPTSDWRPPQITPQRALEVALKALDIE